MKLSLYFYFLIFITSVSSCDNTFEVTCTYEDLEGKYMLQSDTDTSANTLMITLDVDGFTTTGISGYEFMFPAAPLSGRIEGCEVMIDSYENVQREGLSTPGGAKRMYYETMYGSGEYQQEQGLISLNINYTRTGDFIDSYVGNLYLQKID